MSEAKGRKKSRAEVVSKTLDTLKQNYPEDFETLVSENASNVSKAKARKHISKGNDIVIQDMLLIDDKYRDRFSGPVRITISLSVSSFVATAVFLAIAIYFVSQGNSGMGYLIAVAMVEMAAGIALMYRYRYMLSRYLELRIKETFATA